MSPYIPPIKKLTFEQQQPEKTHTNNLREGE